MQVGKKLLELINLTKVYKIRKGGVIRSRFEYIKAIENINLKINRGEILALLGPNGAGKSTICRIAAGMTKPSGGKALLNGVDITNNIRHISKQIGVVLGNSLIYHRLTGYNYLKFFAKVYSVRDWERRIVEVSKLVEMEQWLNAYIESYSLGMKSRISLARALLHEPEFLILDEFTLGLDPRSATRMRETILDMNKTILLTTHNTHEAEIMAEEIAFISKGKIVALGKFDELRRAVSDKAKIIVKLEKRKLVGEMLSQFDGIVFHENSDGKIEVVAREDQVPDVIQLMSGLGITEMSLEKPNLEDAYMYFTGERLKQVEAT